MIKENNEFKLLLDFDAFAENIRSDECLRVTDQLREIVSNEFVDKIKEPIYTYMRQEE